MKQYWKPAGRLELVSVLHKLIIVKLWDIQYRRPGIVGKKQGKKGWGVGGGTATHLAVTGLCGIA